MSTFRDNIAFLGCSIMGVCVCVIMVKLEFHPIVAAIPMAAAWMIYLGFPTAGEIKRAIREDQ